MHRYFSSKCIFFQGLLDILTGKQDYNDYEIDFFKLLTTNITVTAAIFNKIKPEKP